MTEAQYRLYGTSLKSAGLSLIGGGVVILPTGFPMWATAAMGGVGVALQIVGTIFAHLADGMQTKVVNAMATQQAANVTVPVANVPLNPPAPPVT